MANITKRTNKNGEISYLIRVFVDEKATGKQTVKSMTYKPKSNMANTKIEKELNEVVIAFENKVKYGLVAYDGKIKFEEYSARWIENTPLAFKTKERYIGLLKRVNQAIGNIRLEKVQAHHLESFYKNLKEDGIKHNGVYAISKGLDVLMTKRKITVAKLSKMSGLAHSTVRVAREGKRVSSVTAENIAKALKVPVNKIFEVVDSASGLADKTILHHHRLICAILGKAKKERIIPYNVGLEHASAPKVAKKEAVYLDDIQAQRIVELLLIEEDIRVKTSLLVLLYSGVRRGELCGLEWQDIDHKNQLIHIKRASQYQKGIGIVEVPTKNESSVRAVKLPIFIIDVINDYKKWWVAQRSANGKRWQGSNKLFIQEDGKPINPDTINFWLEKFIERNNLPYFTPHSLRHTFATLQIMAGVNLRTIQARTGHAQASTLVNIYSHAIKTADELATEVLDNILTPKSIKDKQG
jgi:integrase